MKTLGKIIQSELFKNTFVYVSTRLINKLIPFFIVPILTIYLSPSDYGVTSTYGAYLSFLLIGIHLSMTGAVNVSFFQLSNHAIQVYIANVILIVVVNAILVMGVVFFFLEDISGALEIPKVWLIIGVCLVFVKFFSELNSILWQVEKKVKPFAIYQILLTFFSTLLVLTLVVKYKMGWQGKLIGETVVLAFFSIVSFLIIYRRGYLRFEFNQKFIKDALRFGIPLLPHALSSWLKNGVDKLLLTMMIGTSATGLYAVGYQFAFILGMIAISFNQSFSPYLYRKLASISKEEKIKLVKMTYAYFVAMLLLATAISMMMPVFISFFLDKRFLQSIEFIPWLVFGFAFYGMYFMVVNYIFYVKKTFVLSIITLLTGVIHVGLSYTLIKINGAVGAAQATTLSFFITFVLVWIWSAKVYQMPWNLKV